MRGNVGIKKFSHGEREATDAAGSDLLFFDLDTGGAQNGTLLLYVDTVAADSDMANVEIWTSNRSDFGSSGTQITAIVSDSLAQVLLTSDESTVYSIGAFEGSVSDITIASNKITAINQKGLYAFNIKHCARYVRIQYDSDGTGCYVSQSFVGHDLAEAPWAGARTAY